MELDKIFKLDNYNLVYELLGNMIKIDDYKEKKKKQNELFIRYLKLKYKSNINNIYEQMLAKFVMLRFTKEILIYLLSLDIDFEYNSRDIFDTPYLLKYLLASNIKDKDVMQVFLKKVNISSIYLGDSRYRSYTDLVRVNIVAGNYRDAINVFNNPNYKLINIDYTSDTKIIEFYANRENIYVDSLGFVGFLDNDMLYQIVLTIKECDIDLDTKKMVLKSFIYSSKVKLFNISILPMVEEILESEYQDFLDYLDTKINNKEIYLLEINSRNSISLIKSLKVKSLNMKKS